MSYYLFSNLKRIPKMIPIALLNFYIFKLNSSIVLMNSEENSSPTGRLIFNINKKINSLEKQVEYLDLNGKNSNELKLEDFPEIKRGKSLLSKVLDIELWKRSYELRTDDGIQINDLIQSGLDNPDHPIGIIAPTPDSYQVFDEILVKIASLFHRRNLTEAVDYKKDNYDQIRISLSNIKEFIENRCVDYEISINRNLKDFQFTPKITREKRRKVADLIINSIKKIENNVFENKGNLLELKHITDTKNYKKDEFLFESKLYRDWPENRFYYLNNSNSLNLFINEEDHLKIVQKSRSLEKDDEKFNKIIRLMLFLEEIEKNLEFAFDDKLGYLNTLPSNLGSGTYFTFKIHLNNDEEFKKLSQLLKENNEISLDLKMIENKLVLSISNNTSFYNFQKFLGDLAKISDILNNSI